MTKPHTLGAPNTMPYAASHATTDAHRMVMHSSVHNGDRPGGDAQSAPRPKQALEWSGVADVSVVCVNTRVPALHVSSPHLVESRQPTCNLLRAKPTRTPADC